MTTEYFSKLNYSLANEDTSLEVELVKRQRPKKILSVCGSGGRTLPLAFDFVDELHFSDLASQQLFLCHLKAETIRKLSYQDYQLFWGYAPYAVEENKVMRKEVFEALELDFEARNYFSKVFEDNSWQSILYLGSWEKTFAFFSKIVSRILGKHTEKFFSFDNLEAQKAYIRTEFPMWRWNFVMSVLGNKSIFNALLYRGNFIKKNIDESYVEYYKKAFYKLFTHDLTRKSFFLQLCFFGKVLYQEGNTIEAHQDVFERMKIFLQNKPLFSHQKDILQVAKEEGPFDFISLSDVPSYFAGDTERNFLQYLKPCLNEDGIIVLRNYLRVPQADRAGYEDISSQFSDLIENEKVQMYRIEILRKIKT